MHLTENGVDMFYDNLFQEQTKLLNDIKSQKSPELDKLNHSEIVLITNLLSSLLKLKKIMKDKQNYNNR